MLYRVWQKNNSLRRRKFRYNGRRYTFHWNSFRGIRYCGICSCISVWFTMWCVVRSTDLTEGAFVDDANSVLVHFFRPRFLRLLRSHGVCDDHVLDLWPGSSERYGAWSDWWRRCYSLLRLGWRLARTCIHYFLCNVRWPSGLFRFQVTFLVLWAHAQSTQTPL